MLGSFRAWVGDVLHAVSHRTRSQQSLVQRQRRNPGVEMGHESKGPAQRPDTGASALPSAPWELPNSLDASPVSISSRCHEPMHQEGLQVLVVAGLGLLGRSDASSHL